MNEGTRIFHRSRAGFTLIEVVTAVAIFSVLAGFMYLTFVTNWSAYDDRIKRADMWQDLNQIMEDISTRARNGRQVTVSSNASNNQQTQTMNVTLPDGTILTYIIQNDGTLTRREAGQPDRVMTSLLDFSNSSFIFLSAKAARIRLALEEKVFTRTIDAVSEVEIFLRN